MEFNLYIFINKNSFNCFLSYINKGNNNIIISFNNDEEGNSNYKNLEEKYKKLKDSNPKDYEKYNLKNLLDYVEKL